LNLLNVDIEAIDNRKERGSAPYLGRCEQLLSRTILNIMKDNKDSEYLEYFNVVIKLCSEEGMP